MRRALTSGTASGVTADLGTTGSPGLKIVDGSVDSVNIHLTGDLDLQDLTFSVKDLGLEYDKPNDTLHGTARPASPGAV